jgi:hypothetical protein
MAITRTRQVRARIKTGAIVAATVINKYDVVTVLAGVTHPVNLEPVTPGTGVHWDTDEVTTQGAIKDAFLGIAMSASKAGDTTPIMVATDVEVYADLTSAAYVAGSMMRLTKTAGNNVNPQTFKAATNDTDALGRFVSEPGTVTAGWIRITGRLPLGGVYPATT